WGINDSEDNTVSSDEEWEGHEYGNPHNNLFPKPYLNTNDKRDENYHKENNGDTNKSSVMVLSGTPHFKKINNEQPNEGVCRVDKFRVIKYTIRDNEEFLAICIRRCDLGHKLLTEYQNHTAYPEDLAETMIWYILKKTRVELIWAL
ncbi:hypothetical protein Tco_1150896, partial [Tanacetum coccineum]